MCNKGDYKTELMRRNKDRHFILTKEIIHQDTANIYASKCNAPNECKRSHGS